MKEVPKNFTSCTLYILPTGGGNCKPRNEHPKAEVYELPRAGPAPDIPALSLGHGLSWAAGGSQDLGLGLTVLEFGM